MSALIPALSYILISTFTPGPSNIASASMAVLYGYKRTLKYQTGLAATVFAIMFLTGWISTTLLGFFPALEPVLRYVGAAYILYLAYRLLRASYVFADSATRSLGFLQGAMLQALNPKLFVYAFTLFSAFLAPMTNNLALVAVVAVLLAMISFSATSVWALFGTAIKTYLQNQRLKVVVNILLALSLVYTALTLIHIV